MSPPRRSTDQFRDDVTAIFDSGGNPAANQDIPDGRFAGYRTATAQESVRANRCWWDAEAAGYRAEHLGHLAGRLVWGPEGLDEGDAGLLGEVAGRKVLEIGAGAGDCTGWLHAQGAQAVATDLSSGMLRQAPDPPSRSGGSGGSDGPSGPPWARLQCDARRLPFAQNSFEVAFSAYGAIPFVADPELIFDELARVLRPGGRLVFSITHPVRWAFPDVPGEEGLRVTRSYFDRTPYVETMDDGALGYAEHHRTLGDRIRSLVRSGFTVLDLVEPEWPADLDRPWGPWSPLRGRLIPGTAIFVCELRPAQVD